MNKKREGLMLFTCILMKCDALEKGPLDMGNRYKLHTSHIHTIEAVGEEYGKTVTALNEYFTFTQGESVQKNGRK